MNKPKEAIEQAIEQFTKSILVLTALRTKEPANDPKSKTTRR